MDFEYADGRIPVAMTSGGQVYYLAYDQVGSLRVVTDAAGAEVKRVEYDSFGNILSDSNSTFTVPFGFAGGLHDRDTGLVRFGARDYDPATGKWTAKDPIDFAGGDLDLLSYTGQDPVNFADPRGNITVDVRTYYVDPIVLQKMIGQLSAIHSSGVNKINPRDLSPLMLEMGVDEDLLNDLLETRKDIELKNQTPCSGSASNRGTKKFKLKSGSKEMGYQELPFGLDAKIGKNISANYQFTDTGMFISNVKGIGTTSFLGFIAHGGVSTINLNSNTGEVVVRSTLRPF